MKKQTLLPMACLLAMLSLLFAGCSSTKKVDWDSRIGNYTYDQAVAEYGPPDKQTTLSDGNLVADWVTPRYSGTSFGLGTGTFGRSGGVGVGVGAGTGRSDRVLRLTFGTDKKLVNVWRNF